MNTKVAIVDYGLGNLFSINQACQKVGLDSVITADHQILAGADAIILPGVGAFGDAMKSLEDNGLIPILLNFVQERKPFMGICLGMQLLFDESEEFGNNKGLGLIGGRVVRFPYLDNNGNINRVPQIQWNQIHSNTKDLWLNSPLQDLGEGTYMHFVHSYYAEPLNQKEILSYSEYGGINYASAVIKDNIVGIQYHPEKSGENGIKIYKSWSNFIKNKSYE